MAKNYSHSLNKRKTSQSQPIPTREAEMQKNNAGGYTFSIDKWKMLDRFLILGSESPTYYVSQKELTHKNTTNVISCIDEDAKKVLDRVVEISLSGRAPKNDPAIFVLALLITLASQKYKREISEAVPKVCRIGTHLFTFVHYVDEMRSWGKAVRRAVSNWYSMNLSNLEYQLVKYQGRTVEGSKNQWTHRDVLRSAHVKPLSDEYNKLFKYAVKGEWNLEEDSLISAVEILKARINRDGVTKESIKDSAMNIAEYKIPHEAWPTQLKRIPEIWEASLDDMPLMATLRNLGLMTNIGVLNSASFSNIDKIVAKFSDQDYIRKSRLHPLAILNALFTYNKGSGIKGSLTWQPVQQIVDALDEAFYLSFANVEPTNKRILLALDVSGSMGSFAAGSTVLNCREASAALALVTANVEKHYTIVGFTGNAKRDPLDMRNSALIPLGISPKQRLDAVIDSISDIPFGRTDCALPMVWAKENKYKYDAIIIYTDNETWFGDIHPSQALKQYRQQIGIDTKLVVVAMTPTQFSIADPKDSGSIDIVGFDTATPNIINDFISGKI